MRGLIVPGQHGAQVWSAISARAATTLLCNQPIAYYPLALQLLAGVREFIFAAPPQVIAQWQQRLGDGQQWGIEISYAVLSKSAQSSKSPQSPQSSSVMQAIMSSSEFIGDHHCAFGWCERLVAPPPRLAELPARFRRGAYGYVLADHANHAKQSTPTVPTVPIANLAHLVFFDRSVTKRAREWTQCQDDAQAFTSLLQTYHADGLLQVEWLDAQHPNLDLSQTTPDATDAFVTAITHAPDLANACPEEICWRRGYIDDAQLARLAHVATAAGDHPYARHLKNLLATRS